MEYQGVIDVNRELEKIYITALDKNNDGDVLALEFDYEELKEIKYDNKGIVKLLKFKDEYEEYNIVLRNNWEKEELAYFIYGKNKKGECK